VKRTICIPLTVAHRPLHISEGPDVPLEEIDAIGDLILIPGKVGGADEMDHRIINCIERVWEIAWRSVPMERAPMERER
jgi:hypothetical protein